MFPTLAPVTRALIIACVVMFALEFVAGGALIAYLALWPIGTTAQDTGALGFQPWQIVTYSMLHDPNGFAHVFFNMFALYMFGGEIERVVGPRRYLNLYVVAVITAALTQLLFAASAASAPYPTVGASGGIFGLLLAYAMYFPRRIVVLLIPPIPMPAWVFVILYGVLELYLGVTATQGGVAHFAHLGGMLGAWLVIRYWRGQPPFARR
jgi:membrane associated rhomboid family serine protease